MRGVLCLFEGVATGAADGYARVAGRPAAALLHLGPGLGNGLANLHNARRAHTPVLTVVGDHATSACPLRRSPHLGHRVGCPLGLGLVPRRRPPRRGRARRGRGRGGIVRTPGVRGHAGGARRRVVGRVHHRDGGAADPGASSAGAPTRPWRRRRAPFVRASGPPCCSGAAALRKTRSVARQPRGGVLGSDALRRDLPGQPRARRGHPRGGTPGLPGRDGAGPVGRGPTPRPGRSPVPRLLLRLRGQGGRPGPT